MGRASAWVPAGVIAVPSPIAKPAPEAQAEAHSTRLGSRAKCSRATAMSPGTSVPSARWASSMDSAPVARATSMHTAPASTAHRAPMPPARSSAQR